MTRRVIYPTLAESIERIIQKIADEHRVSKEQMCSADRQTYIVRAREHAMAVIYWSAYPELSYPDVGRLFNKDHTTVIAAVNRYEARLNDEITVYRVSRKKRLEEVGVTDTPVMKGEVE